jgi:hypothetical protein
MPGHVPRDVQDGSLDPARGGIDGAGSRRLTPFFRAEGLGPDTAHFMRALSVAYAELAKKKGTRFISLYRVVSPENLEDGVHANGKGQIQIADAVWKGLQRR